jgi:hypothetical protein
LITGATDCGSTIDPTRLAHRMPSVISSARATAVFSNKGGDSDQRA